MVHRPTVVLQILVKQNFKKLKSNQILVIMEHKIETPQGQLPSGPLFSNSVILDTKKKQF